MALSKELEEELKCPIHLDLYIRPRALRCLHTLCKEDVDIMLDRDGLLQCPQCKKVSRQRDIKPDFRMQRLLDLHRANEQRLKEQKLCDSCEDEIVSAWCEDCGIFIGERCERGHLKMEVTKHHVLLKANDMADTNKAIIEDVLKKMEDTLTQLGENQETLNRYLTSFDLSISAKLDKINASEVTIITATRRVHDELRENYRESTGILRGHLESAVHDIKTKETGLKHEIGHLKNFLENAEQSILLDKDLIMDYTEQSTHNCTKVEKEIKEYVTPHSCSEIIDTEINIYKQLERWQDMMETYLNPDYVPKEDNSRTEQLSAPIEDFFAIDQATSNSIESDRSSNKLSSRSSPQSDSTNIPPSHTLVDYTQMSLRSESIYEYTEEVESVSYVGENIWSVMCSGVIHVMDRNPDGESSVTRIVRITHVDGNEVRQYRAKKVSVVGADTKIALCSSKKLHRDKYQLVQIDNNGSVKHVIDSGDFCDVVSHNKHIFVLYRKGNHSKVTIYTLDSYGWAKGKTVNLASVCTGFVVHGDTLTFTEERAKLWRHGRKVVAIFRYNLQTETEILVEDTIDNSTRVLLSDKAGNVLLITRDKLCVLLEDNSISEVMAGVIENLSSAIMDKTGQLTILHDKTLMHLSTR